MGLAGMNDPRSQRPIHGRHHRPPPAPPCSLLFPLAYRQLSKCICPIWSGRFSRQSQQQTAQDMEVPFRIQLPGPKTTSSSPQSPRENHISSSVRSSSPTVQVELAFPVRSCCIAYAWSLSACPRPLSTPKKPTGSPCHSFFFFFFPSHSALR
ncbi:hypothetical protein LY76DRAFT_75969 [Colletotrichum caudatum]|nr:hypothetical protein LY76DRAFT_75969 [Colletotrichum caudatum]